MAAHRDAGPVDVAEVLAVARLDDGVNVDVLAVGVPGKLIGETDIDVPVGRLGEFCQLAGLGGAKVPDAVRSRQIVPGVEVEHSLVELDPLGRRFFGEPAHQLRVFAQVCENTSGEHAFRAEHNVEVLPGDQTRKRFQHRGEPGAGGANGQGCFVGDEGARRQPAADARGGRVHPAEVGDAVRVDEQRYHDDHGVAAAYRVGGIQRCGEIAGTHDGGES